MANEVVDLLTPASSILFKTKHDFVITGRSIQTHSESVMDFPFDKSLYADDKADFFATRMEFQTGIHVIYNFLKRFGPTCHVRRNKAKSKTEAMFFPAPEVSNEGADTNPILINTGVDTGEIPFTTTFKLGGTLANNMTDGSEVELEIKVP